jgi:gluconolactonase
VSVFRAPCRFENGHTRDREGRLISCSHHDRCISRTEHDGGITIMADTYGGRRLNSPNDVVVAADGAIWFSDPPYGINSDYEGGKQQAELPPTLYRLDGGTGDLAIAADDLDGPNGLCFAPDGSRLYVAETGEQFADNPTQHIRVFDGNLWSSAADGVHCLSPEGELLGKIKVPWLVSNLAFGGRNRSELFLCASHTLCAITVNRRGAQWP